MGTRVHRAWTAAIAVLLAVGLALWSVAPASAGSSRGGLSQAELDRLEQGELVERRVVQRRGGLRLMGGTSWQLIDAEPAVVWRALLDTRHYDRMMPQVIEARLVEETPEHRTLFMRQGNPVLHTSYYLEVAIDRERRAVRFSKDESRPAALRAAWGFYEVRPYGPHRTLLAYGVMADPGDGLIGGLLRGTVHEWMMKVPWMMKRFIEGSGRALYEAPNT